MAGQSLELAAGILDGKKPEKNVILLDPVLITGDNINDYKGWTSH
jgi:ribose transport system substrate-binding protein